MGILRPASTALLIALWLAFPMQSLQSLKEFAMHCIEVDRIDPARVHNHL